MSGEWEGERPEKQLAKGASWGPVVVKESDFVTRATAPGGRSVEISLYVRERRELGIGLEGKLETGLPVRLDGVDAGSALQHGRRDWSGIAKPGRIWFEGDDTSFFTPGLRAQGHVTPNQMTLKDEQGWLVRPRPVVGVVNLDLLPLPVRPRVHQRATPEHVALWVVSWLVFNGTY